MLNPMPPVSEACADEFWDLKYRLKNPDGTSEEPTRFHTFRRVANDLAAVEKESAYWGSQFYDIMALGEFLPAGRIISGAGTGRSVTMMNCYVMGTIPDSIEGIFDHLKEAALTMQQGGGIGYDFSTLRPMGALVQGVGSPASGPLPFMDTWDAMCRTIMSAGSRRGAMMATMRCDHPDIEAFIEAKKDPARLRMFNVSVLVTDDFMEAVKQGYPWRLSFENQHGEVLIERTVQARDLWDKIMRSTYAQAEPGVIFIDRINAENNLSYIETIAATNPCGEQPLPPYGSCLLGSIVLPQFVGKAFSKLPTIDYQRLEQVVGIAVRMMDNVIDVTKFPLPEQNIEAKNKRRIGIGVTGLGDALIMMGYEYGTPEAVAVTYFVMSSIAHYAYAASVELAKEKGAFPAFDAAYYLSGEHFAGRLDEALQVKIRSHGIRNSHLLSVAPTGTISLLAGNVSSGIEPIFAAEYTRKVLQPDGTKTEVKMLDFAVALWREKFSVPKLPTAYIDAQTLTPLAHVEMQAAAQRWVDSAVSKTINLPEDISFEDFKLVYELAYASGCKGCTTYRPNDVTGSVLSVDKPVEKAPAPVDEPAQVTQTTPLRPVPDVLHGMRYKIKLGSDPALYVHINDDADGRPFEIFFNGKEVQHQAWTSALSRMISAIFRRGGDISFVPEELRAIHDPVGGGFTGGKRVASLPAAIGDVIAKHMTTTRWHAEVRGVSEQNEKRKASICPSCSSPNLYREEGCMKCAACGYSKCG